MSDTPNGVKALLFEEAALKESLENVALDVFALYGCSRITLPAIEYWTSLTKGLDDIGKKRAINFADSAGGGEPLALRSDVTPQIARIAATTLKERPLPLRLSYAETVYRSIAPGLGRRMEVYQAGVEYIGHAAPVADAEVISIGAETLLALGIEREKITLSISHGGYIRAAFDELALDVETRAELQQALGLKARGVVQEILTRINATGPASDALASVTTLFGGVELLTKALRFNEAAAAALDNLTAVVDHLAEKGLADIIGIDLGEVRGFSYYTGVTFEGFVSGMSKRAFSGGRYDTLLARYGADRPATGFAIDIDHLLEHFHRETADWRSADILLVGGDAHLAETLRSEGIGVAQEFIQRSCDDSLASARSHRIAMVAVVEPAGNIRLIETTTGNEEIVSANELADRFGAPAQEEGSDAD